MQKKGVTGKEIATKMRMHLKKLSLVLVDKESLGRRKNSKIMGNWIDQNDSKRPKQGSNERWRFETNHIVGK